MKRNEEIAFYLEDEETLVLGTLMNTRDSLAEVSGLLNEDCFYNNFHRMIYRAIKSIDSRGERYDVISVFRELHGKIDEVKDRPRVFEIGGRQCFDLYQHVAYLKDASARRKIEEKLKHALSLVYCVTEDPFEMIETICAGLNDIYPDQSSGVVSMREVMQQVYESIDRNLTNPGQAVGSFTGFRELDSRGVLRPGNLTVIGADSSQGKTSFAASICLNAAMAGTGIAFYTMEMFPQEVGQRILSQTSGVNGIRISCSALTPEELSRTDKGLSRLVDLPLYFDGESTSSPDSIIASIRMMKKRFNIEGAVVDYLQILSVNGNRNDTSGTEMQMGCIARRLKNLAKDLGIWILALSQLSRDKMDVAPNIGRIRGSGQITEAADVVILIYRPEHYGCDKRYPEPFANISTRNTAMIDVAKGRNTGTWKMICGFDAATTHFYDLDELPHIDSSIAGKEKKPF